ISASPSEPQIDTTALDLDNEVKQQPPAAYQLTPALVASQRIDPMIGMDGITPQMFMTKEN
ncbi:hypothetical protein K9853_11965, partial [Lacticaseibacillus paracasei]